MKQLTSIREVGRLLIEKEFSNALPESATGGRLCAEFALLDNAGSFRKGRIACYDVRLNEDLLNVGRNSSEISPPNLWDEKGNNPRTFRTDPCRHTYWYNRTYLSGRKRDGGCR